MSDALKIALTSAFTILGGIIIFIVGEIIQKFVIVPIQNHRAAIGRVDNELKFYAYIITNPVTQPGALPETYIECHKVLRKLSCDLETTWKQLFFGNKERGKEIADAARRLIRLSNSLSVGSSALRNADDHDRIRELLKIPELV